MPGTQLEVLTFRTVWYRLSTLGGERKRPLLNPENSECSSSHLGINIGMVTSRETCRAVDVVKYTYEGEFGRRVRLKTIAYRTYGWQH